MTMTGRKGHGTLLRFHVVQGERYLTLALKNGQKITAPITMEASESIGVTYGVRDQRNPAAYHLNALYGSAMTYQQTSQGLIVEAKILPN
jgi:hypothetical protein